jgi:glucose 1-dehydrogenase
VEAAVSALKQQGARISGQTVGVSDLAQVRALAEHTVQTFGKIDIWVNNAGAAGVYGPTAAIDLQEFERIVRTIVFGEYYGSVVALQQFLTQGTGGKLINLLGRGDRNPVPYQSAYGSSKAWVRNFTLALAKEYAGTGIGIYAFNPGLVNTDLLRKIDVIEGYDGQLRRFSTIIRWWANPPATPAEKAVELASSATDGKTGLEVNILGPRILLGGILHDVWRKVTRQPMPDTSLHLNMIAPK